MSQYDRKSVQTLEGRTARYELIPVVAAGAIPVGLALVSGAKDFGADQAFTPLGAAAYWLCGAFVDITDEAVGWEVRFRDATPTLLWAFRAQMAVAGITGMFAPPFPIFMPGAAVLNGSAKATTIAKVLGVTALIGRAI